MFQKIEQFEDIPGSKSHYEKIRVPLSNYISSINSVDELNKLLQQKQAEIELITNTSETDMWLQDLSELTQIYKKELHKEMTEWRHDFHSKFIYCV